MSDKPYDYEYRAEFWDNHGTDVGPWVPVCYLLDSDGWTTSADTAQDDQEQAYADGQKTRLVRRAIGYPEVVK